MSFLVLSDCWWNLFWDYGSARFTDNIFLMNREHFSRREVFLWGGMQQVQGRFTGGVWLMGSWFALTLLSPRASSPLTFPALLTSPIIHLLAKGVLYKALHSFNVMWTFAKPPLYDQHQVDFEKVLRPGGKFGSMHPVLCWWHGGRHWAFLHCDGFSAMMAWREACRSPAYMALRPVHQGDGEGCAGEEGDGNVDHPVSLGALRLSDAPPRLLTIAHQLCIFPILVTVENCAFFVWQKTHPEKFTDFSVV